MLYINKGLRVRRYDDLNIIIERKAKRTNKETGKGTMIWKVLGYYGNLASAMQGLFDYMTTEEMDKNMHSLESLKKSIESIGKKLGEINGTWEI